METDGLTTGFDDGDVDLSDETQDFRFLANITKKGGAGSIPKRGEKDFEPDGTNLQSSTLDDSRNAMFQALSVERSHTGKTRATATWHPTRRLAQIHEQRGVLFKAMGRADKTGTMWLLPEELMYMVERGSLECFYEQEQEIQTPAGTDGKSEQGININVPMSVQAVYAAALEATGGLERYQVYSNLKRSGYIVFRDPEGQFDDLFRNVGYEYKAPPPVGRGWNIWGLGIFGALFNNVFWGTGKGDPFQSMLAPGAYRSYAEMYKRLAIPRKEITWTPTAKAGGEKAKTSPFTVTYHVWKPRPNFKKSAPGPPDFYVCVVSTLDTRLPSLAEIDGLFKDIPEVDRATAREKGLYQGLKEGRRNVILATVDYGVISYMKFSDSRFGDEMLDVDPPAKGKGKPGNKGGKGGAPAKK
ncbi:tRNA-splicing endonuclease subunit sen54 [Arthrobotrys musiformis]|uniref:tRNA-splicing endonuclease subunit sen54 n=1 Tax=Arthrobotrys musiformis TaxID=47236 RepID=A0AAV9VVY9_9PEZI